MEVVGANDDPVRAAPLAKGRSAGTHRLGGGDGAALGTGRTDRAAPGGTRRAHGRRDGWLAGSNAASVRRPARAAVRSGLQHCLDLGAGADRASAAKVIAVAGSTALFGARMQDGRLTSPRVSPPAYGRRTGFDGGMSRSRLPPRRGLTSAVSARLPRRRPAPVRGERGERRDDNGDAKFGNNDGLLKRWWVEPGSGRSGGVLCRHRQARQLGKRPPTRQWYCIARK